MEVGSLELVHNGKNWELNILMSNTASQTTVNVTDQEARELQHVGVPVYDAEAN